MINLLRNTLITAALTCAVIPSVQAAVPQENWLKLNQAIVNEHVMPGYRVLAQESKALEKATAQLCTNPNQQLLEQSRIQFRATLAAWQGIQHVTFGPIELLMRSYSIQFWPDKKNLTSKQLNKLLQAEDTATLTQEYFQTASIAVKGLPAMERVLFGDDALAQIKASAYRCEFIHAVSQYLQTQSQNTFNEWHEFQQEFSYLESEEGLYENAQEATIDLMKAQVEPLEVIRDLKLIRPLGKKRAKAKRLESWRSEHSLQNLQINLNSLHHMYSGLEAYNLKQLLEEQGATDLAQGIETQFQALEAILSKLPAPLSKHVTEPEVRNQLLLLVEGLTLLSRSLEQSMNLLELQLGFNSRDGD